MTFKPLHCLPGLSLLLALIALPSFAQDKVKAEGRGWTEAFGEEGCAFISRGTHSFFILEPGYQMGFEGLEGKDTVRLTITVLSETKTVGPVETRVVEERESRSGDLIEVSRNYYALCTRTSSVFYFGEDVDIYKAGKVVGHEGSWLAYANRARPGIMMPGTVLLGSRYYQEVASGVALDRAEIVSHTEKVRTPAGTFENCLKVEETTPLEPGHREYKYYAVGIGLVRDGDLVLTRHGYVKQ